MNCIKTLSDEDFGLKSIPFDNPRFRQAARGIVFNENNEIAVLYKELKNEYKLIGGGILHKEESTAAFYREVLEETGYIIKISDYLGIIEEHKSQDNFKQTSFVYVAHIIENTGHQSLSVKEAGEKSKLLWCSIDKAMDLIKNSEDKLIASKFEGNLSVYHTKFIIRRDYEILKYYQNLFSPRMT